MGQERASVALSRSSSRSFGKVDLMMQLEVNELKAKKQREKEKRAKEQEEKRESMRTFRLKEWPPTVFVDKAKDPEADRELDVLISQQRKRLMIKEASNTLMEIKRKMIKRYKTVKKEVVLKGLENNDSQAISSGKIKDDEYVPLLSEVDNQPNYTYDYRGNVLKKDRNVAERLPDLDIQGMAFKNLENDASMKLLTDYSQAEASFQEKMDRALKRQLTVEMDDDGIQESNFHIREHMRPTYGCNFTENKFKSEGPQYKDKFKGKKLKMDRQEYELKFAKRMDLLKQRA